MNEQLFNETCKQVLSGAVDLGGVLADSSHIGTLKEKTVHAVVKNYIEPDSSYQEIKIQGFYADIFNKNGIIEVQTGNFNTLRKKLDALLDLYSFTIVYPIAHTKMLYWINNETGEINKPRKSNKKGKPHEIFRELYKIKNYLNHPNIKLHIIMMDMDEYRLLDGWGKNKKNNATKCDRIPTKLINEITINSLDDYKVFLPPNLPDTFTVKDYRLTSRIMQRQASVGVHILNYLGLIKKIGKEGRAYLYTKNPPA